jgi:phasin family protein
MHKKTLECPCALHYFSLVAIQGRSHPGYTVMRVHVDRSMRMATQFEDFQKISKDQMEQFSATAASVARGFQAIATETTDYSKRSIESTSSFVEKLFGAKSVDTAIQLQSEFAKAQMEGFIAQATKIGEIYKDIAKEAFKPVEAAMAKGQEAVHQA